MRITIELPDRLRAEVMSLSAQRGYRGYGRVIVEAVEHYLAALDTRKTELARVLAMSGSWSKENAEETRLKVAEARSNYRRTRQ